MKPEFTMTAVPGSNKITAGAGLEFNLNGYLSGRTTTSYGIEALVASTSDLSICRVTFINRGSNVACPYPKVRPVYSLNYTKALLDMGTVADYGKLFVKCLCTKIV